MSSFYAELDVAGNTYPLRQCQFEFEQATDARGRVVAKVRHGQVHLTLDVPDNDLLLDWANTAHKLLAGHVTFFDTGRRTARETVSFAAGQCVSYQESFTAGDASNGAYVCQLVIATSALVLTPGGAPGAFVAPAARAYATAAPAIAAALQKAEALSEVPESLAAAGNNYLTVSMDPDYVGEETGDVWGTAVTYLSAEEREAYKLLVGQDGLLYDANVQPFDTTGAGTVTGKGKAIFVMSETGDIYASLTQQAGIFHHSSFLAGGPVAAAGELEVANGLVKTVSNRSGHYTPDQSYTHQFVEQLWRKGAKGTDAIAILDFEH